MKFKCKWIPELEPDAAPVEDVVGLLPDQIEYVRRLRADGIPDAETVAQMFAANRRLDLIHNGFVCIEATPVN